MIIPGMERNPHLAEFSIVGWILPVGLRWTLGRGRRYNGISLLAGSVHHRIAVWSGMLVVTGNSARRVISSPPDVSVVRKHAPDI